MTGDDDDKLVAAPHGGLVPVSRLRAAQLRELGETFLARRSKRTAQTYRENLVSFARWLEHHGLLDDADPEAAMLYLLRQPDDAAANLLVSRYVTYLRTVDRPGGRRGYAANTVNQRLYTLRALVQLANDAGLVKWALNVKAEERVAYRDTRGPGREGYQALLLACSRIDNATRRARDELILRLVYECALRREEVVTLDWPEHVDLDDGCLWVAGKKRDGARERVTMPATVRVAMVTWLDTRGRDAGPLIISLDRARKGTGRLTGRGLLGTLKRISREVGLEAKTRTHGLRHAAITDALDATNGDLRSVQRFSRHRDPRSLLPYDDNRQDLGGKVAELVAARANPTSGDGDGDES